MRKQTKLVAVLSAAALLAIGASMTSFAAWQKNDDGTWSYYDRSNDLVSDEWQKDGSKWFYLDDEGIMLTDSWVDDEYYVAEDGSMLVNTWKKLADSEDVSDPEDEGDHWFYFDSKGKKVDSKSKKITGKTYYFDGDGRMQDGWYGDNGELYYLGGEDEGWRSSGWLWLESPDISDVTGHNDDGTCPSKICDDEGWYYFNTANGTVYRDSGLKKINGKYYYFNKHGQMMYEWVNAADTYATPASANNTTDGNFTGTPANVYAGNMVYTNDVEEGWRADGWYEIDGAKSTGKQDDTSWYYFKDGKAKKAPLKVGTTDQRITTDGDGVRIYRDRIKIKASKNSYFCFDEVGQMKTGLQAIGNGSSVNFYYFDDNGYMKTGKVGEVENDDSTYYYSFSNKNGDNGQGATSVTDGYLYWNGKRLEADDDYRIYELAPGDYYLVDTKGKIQKSESKEYDVENWLSAGTQENIKFKFNGSKVAQYSVKTATDTFPAYTTIGSVMGGTTNTSTIPEIKLYDKTYRMTGANGLGTWR